MSTTRTALYLIVIAALWIAAMNMDYTEQLEVELAHVAQRCPAGAGREGAQ